MKLYYRLVGHRTRITYWSNSEFAKWIQKVTKVTPKPSAATAEEWTQWRRENKEKLGYWITEDLLDVLQDTVMFFPDVYRNIETYIQNRWVDKTHYLKTGLKPGQWYEYDTQLEEGIFNSFIDHVENDNEVYDINDDGEFVWVGHKKPGARERILKHLDWEIGLGEESPIQSKSAEDQKEIYLWLKDVRPNRKDPMDAVGLSRFYEERRGNREDDDEDDFFHLFSFKDEEEKKKSLELSKKADQLEQIYHDQDTDMLVRIINIRRTLWS